MLRFLCNECKSEIPDEGQALNITVSLPKTENQRTARGHLCVKCARDLLATLDMPYPVETKTEQPRLPYRNERDVKLGKDLPPARSWQPGRNR